MSIVIELSRVRDVSALAADWNALEAHAPHSFFQGWAWTGCRFAERFDDPVLLRAHDHGRTLALMLFNRRGGTLGPATLYLGESGVAALDAPYVEYNGAVIHADAPPDLPRALLAAARTANLDGRRPMVPRRLVLSGVDAATREMAALPGGRLATIREHGAPHVDLAALRAAGRAPIDCLSANSRQQLRRSLRRYEAAGPLAIARAADPHAALDALAMLHQASWTRRGQPGAFANPFFGAFHHELIDRAPTATDLLRITAGEQTVGYLYNFHHRGRVSAYQSGFDYGGADKHQKPGLVCHFLAIRMYEREGADMYDFLAGADRYKQSLSNGANELFWLRLNPGLGEIIRRA